MPRRRLSPRTEKKTEHCLLSVFHEFVGVAANTLARCLVRLRAVRLDKRFIAVTIGFADPHGLAADDSVELAMPAAPGDIARRIGELRGAALLDGGAPDQPTVISSLCDVVLRTSAFLADFTDEVAAVELRPVAVLVGGDLEVREARVDVTDAFERALR